jgi:hypothetical protein
MRGRGAGRWEAVACGEVKQQPARLEAREGTRVARATALGTRVACDKEGKGNRNKGNSNKGGGQVMATRAMVRVTATATMWAMATAMRLAGDKEGKGKGSKGQW